MTSELRTEREGHTLVLTLQRDERSGRLSEQVVAAGIEILNVAEASDDVHVLVLTSANLADPPTADNRDLDGVQSAAHCGIESTTAGVVQRLRRLQQWTEALKAFPKPVVGALDGQVVDEAFALWMACDLIIASRDSRFLITAPTAAVGGWVWNALQALPRPLVAQMLWLQEACTASRLHELGWVNRVVEPGLARSEALLCAKQLQTASAEQLCISKEWLNRWPNCSFTDFLDAELKSVADR